jgi:hypothetical protein
MEEFTGLLFEGNGIFIAGNDMNTLGGKPVNDLVYVDLDSASPLQIFPDLGIVNIFNMVVHENKLYFSGDFRYLDQVYHPFLASITYQNSGSVGISNSNIKGTGSLIYPVPAYENVNIKLDEPASSVWLRITDLNGKIHQSSVVEKTADQVIRINIRELPDGMYIIDWKSDSESGYAKFIKR